MRPNTYLSTLWNTITSPKYYIDILNTKFGFSVRFLLVSYLLLAAVSGVLFALFDAADLQQKVDQSIQKVSTEFPANYSAEWNGLKIVPTSTAGATTTLTLPLPALREFQQSPPLLAQLNPTVTSVAEIAAHTQKPSFFFIGNHELYMSQPNDTWKTMPLTALLPTSSFHLDKQAVSQYIPSVQQQVDQSLKLLPFLISIVFFFLTLPLRLISMCLDTLLIYLVVRMTGLPISFKKAVQLSLHIMVVAEIISLLTATVAQDLPMFSLTFWLYTLIVYWQLRHIKALPLNVVGHQDKDRW